MNIKQFIEFLQTLPQDATVQVLSHTAGSGFNGVGGYCVVEDFTTECEEWSSYGEHYEFTTDSSGQMFLQLGVMDK